MRAIIRFVRRYPVIPLTVIVGLVTVGLDAVGNHAVARWVATVFVGAFVLWTVVGMVRDILRGHFGLDILAVVAMVATLAVGEYVAAIVVMLMLSGGEALEDFAGRRAKRDLAALLDHAPQVAHRILADGSTDDVPVGDVLPGDDLLIKPSEVLPVDAELRSEAADLDESSLTGESLPVAHERGDELRSGSVNGVDAIRVRALRAAADSQYQQIVALVREAEDSKAPTVRLADRYAVPFTIVSLVIAGIAWAVSGEAGRFAEVLVLATPCPLLIAAPVAFLGGLSQTAKRGVVVKGGAVLEQLAQIRSAAFDKTGTLTRGRPELIAVRPADGFDERDLLRDAASAEQYSSHVLASGILRAAVERGIALVSSEEASEVATNGVVARIDGREVAVGKPAYIAALAPDTRMADLEPGQAAAYVAVDGRFAGVLVLADDVRDEAAATIRRLRDSGVERVVMLTGDVAPTARSVASGLGVAEVHAELLPADKVRLAAELTPRPVMMVGDGVNDAPVLAAADVGVAIGARGSTAAGEAASAVVLRDSIAPVADAVAISQHTLRVAKTAIWIGIALSIALMLIATTGVIPAVAGALTQEAVDLATILYALRALRPPKGLRPLGEARSTAPVRVPADATR